MPRQNGATWAAFPETKFFVADLPTWHVPRSRLHGLLRPSDSVSLTAVVGPAGAGKTQLIREWLVDQTCPWVWLSINERDDDAEAWLGALIAALRHIHPGWGGEALDMLDEDATDSSLVLRSLLIDLSDDVVPAVIVMDDLHRLTRFDVHQLFEEFIDALPVPMHVVVSSRADPPVRMGRMRAAGRLGEVRSTDLRFEHEEAAALLGNSGLHLAPAHIDALMRRTEGWAAGLRLAALALAGGADPDEFVAGFDGTNQSVAELLIDEVLSRQPADIRSFLLSTSVLDELDGGICDHLSGRDDSTELLRDLYRRQLFLIPLDRVGLRFRYHHLFADFLRFELRMREPDRELELHSRAIEFFDRTGDTPASIDHAVAAGDFERAFALLVKHRQMTMMQRLEAPRVRRWLAEIPDGVISDNAERSAQFGLLLGFAGKLDEGVRWVARADELAANSTDEVRSRILLVKAFAAAVTGDLDTLESLRLQSLDLAGSTERATDIDERIATWRIRLMAMSGRTGEARASLDDLRTNNPVTLAAYALDMLDAELCVSEDDVRRCQHFADRAIATWRADPRPGEFGATLLLQARAWAHLQSDEPAEAEQLLEEGLRLCDGISARLIHVTLCVLGTAELAFQQGLIGEAEQRLESHLYDRGGVAGTVLEARVEALRTRIRVASTAEPATMLPFGQVLSPREMTVLAHLSTHLQGREIAEQLYVSTNTLKTHTKAIYRKLGTSSRSESVAVARSLGLIP